MLADGLGLQTVRTAFQVQGTPSSHALDLDIVEVNPLPQIRESRAARTRHVDITVVERIRSITLGRSAERCARLNAIVPPRSPPPACRCALAWADDGWLCGQRPPGQRGVSTGTPTESASVRATSWRLRGTIKTIPISTKTVTRTPTTAISVCTVSSPRA